MAPVLVGLVGAGPWATLVHAPLLASGPETRLAGVWARRLEAASALATVHDAPAFGSFEALLDASEAVAFAVPPDVQGELAARAARAGRSVLLEKPIAADLPSARRLASAVDDTGVASVVVLSWRYSPVVRRFLAEAADLAATGGRAAFLSGTFLGGPFATPWRLERGPLLDLGPHVIDILDAALGPVVDVRAHGDRTGWVGLLLDHAGGARSEASLCAGVGTDPSVAGVELYGPKGSLTLDCTGLGHEGFAALRAEFAEAVRGGGGHPLDVHRGLHLQEVIASAEDQLR